MLLRISLCCFFVRFQSRCRDLGVGESHCDAAGDYFARFQSRCRDLGVGEGRCLFGGHNVLSRFSLVAEIWGLASLSSLLKASSLSLFQSRCRDLGVGEAPRAERLSHTQSLFQSRCRDLGVGEQTKPQG